MRLNKGRPISPVRTKSVEHTWKLGGWPGHSKPIRTQWGQGFRSVMMMPRKRAAPGAQRVMVRVRYSAGHSAGLWYAHGRYIQRGSAAVSVFDQQGTPADAARTLHQWQKAGDQRMWKAIVSPERGRDLDLEAFAREFMAQVEADRGQPLEWVAAVHDNTDHPHIHFAIRGVDQNGKQVRLPREYIKHEMRAKAQELATQKLGLRQPAHTLNRSILDALKLFKAARRGMNG